MIDRLDAMSVLLLIVEIGGFSAACRALQIPLPTVRFGVDDCGKQTWLASCQPAAKTLCCRSSMLVLGWKSEPKVAQRRMVIRPSSEWPAVSAVTLVKGGVIDAGHAAAHQPSLIEVPVLVTIRSEPIAAIVVPLVSKAY
jgi:hypothetical protein